MRHVTFGYSHLPGTDKFLIHCQMMRWMLTDNNDKVTQNCLDFYENKNVNKMYGIIKKCHCH